MEGGRWEGKLEKGGRDGEERKGEEGKFEVGKVGEGVRVEVKKGTGWIDMGMMAE